MGIWWVGRATRKGWVQRGTRSTSVYACDTAPTCRLANALLNFSPEELLTPSLSSTWAFLTDIITLGTQAASRTDMEGANLDNVSGVGLDGLRGHLLVWGLVLDVV